MALAYYVLMVVGSFDLFIILVLITLTLAARRKKIWLPLTGSILTGLISVVLLLLPAILSILGR